MIDPEKFAEHSVSAYVVKEYVNSPSIPEDDDIILVAQDFNSLPMGIVNEVHKV